MTNRHNILDRIRFTLTLLERGAPLAVAAHVGRELGFESLSEKYIQNHWNIRSEGYQPKIAWVHPQEIIYQARFPFPVQGQSAVFGKGMGSWDQCRVEFDQEMTYTSIESHYVHGRPWEETRKYQKIVNKTSEEPIETADSFFDSVDDVYTNMKENGYVSQVELFQKFNSTVKPKPMGSWYLPDEIRIAIGRNGELIRTTCGKHRLSIAKVLGINAKIPVVIQLVHDQWDGELEGEMLTTEHPLVKSEDHH